MNTLTGALRGVLLCALAMQAVACDDDDATVVDAGSGIDAGARDSGAGIDAQAALSDGEVAAVSAAINSGEVQQGQLAQSRATDAEVRAFADMMVNDHSRVITDQEQLLQRIGVAPMANALSQQVTAEGMSTLQSLMSRTGADFDRAYIDAQVAMHTRALTLLDDRLIPSARNAEFRTFLQTVRASVQQHLTRARQIQSDGGA